MENFLLSVDDFGAGDTGSVSFGEDKFYHVRFIDDCCEGDTTTIGDDNVDTVIDSGGAAVSPETVRYFLSLDMKVFFY